MIVAGIGCRKGVDEKDVLGVIAAALTEHRLAQSELSALATAKLKQHEEAIFSAAHRLGLAVIIVGNNELAAAGRQAISHLELSLAMTGAPSVSEAAALAAVGEGGRLLGPRLVLNSVTCAIAISGDAA